MKLQYTLLLSAMFAVSAHAVEPAGYYTPCENKGGSSLLSALCEKVGPHTVISYDGLLDLYKTSDVYSDGKSGTCTLPSTGPQAIPAAAAATNA